jgi:hypothetical protein
VKVKKTVNDGRRLNLLFGRTFTTCKNGFSCNRPDKQFSLFVLGAESELQL